MVTPSTKEKALNEISWLSNFVYIMLNRVNRGHGEYSIKECLDQLEEANKAIYRIKREVMRLKNLNEIK